MAEYSRMAKGHFTSTGNAQVVPLPFQPDRVEMLNFTLAAAGAAASKIISAEWDVSMGQGNCIVQGYTSGSALVYDNVATNGISSYSAGLSQQMGPLVLLGTTGGAGIAKTSATQLTVTTAAANTVQAGQWIVFQNLFETSTTGMQTLAGIPFQVISVTSSTVFIVSWVGNAANLTAIDTSATGAAGFKQILYPALYCPGVAFPWTITVTSGVGTVNTTAPHNFQVGQQIAFRIPSVYGAQNLNENYGLPIPGAQQTFYVATVASSNVFTFNSAPALSTAFSVAAPAFTSFPGLRFAQVVAVGDVNSGGFAYSGGSLYPSPQFYNGFSTSIANSINGPALLGSYCNNTSQGFIIGSGAGTAISSGVLVGANTNVIYWKAFLDDLQVN